MAALLHKGSELSLRVDGLRVDWFNAGLNIHTSEPADYLSFRVWRQSLDWQTSEEEWKLLANSTFLTQQPKYTAIHHLFPLAEQIFEVVTKSRSEVPTEKEYLEAEYRVGLAKIACLGPYTAKRIVPKHFDLFPSDFPVRNKKGF